MYNINVHSWIVVVIYILVLNKNSDKMRAIRTSAFAN